MFYYKQETNYEAPKWMEGEYKLKVHGRKITIERLSVADDGIPTKSHATCHKHDQFDIGEGAKVALDRLKDKKVEADARIKVGDAVKLIRGGRAFTSIPHLDETTWATRYRYGVSPLVGMEGRVVGWFDGVEEGMAIVEEDNGKNFGNPEYTHLDCCHGIYVIGCDALKKV